MQRVVGIAKRFVTEFAKNDLPEFAAGLAYRSLFAIFPFGLFLAALSAYVARWIGIEDPTGQVLGVLGDNLPPDVANAIGPELQRVIGTAHPELVSIGALAALWAATGGMNSLIKGMNKAFEVEETRSFVRKTVIAIVLTLMATIGVVLSFVTIVGGSLITDQVAQQLGLTSEWRTLSLLRWPMVGLALTVAVAVLYRLAPDTRLPWRWAFIGAAVFTVGWLLATALFAWYLSNIANFGAAYGALGGVIVLMLWFYLTGLLLIGSAQLIAVLITEFDPQEAGGAGIERATPPPTRVEASRARRRDRRWRSSPRERGSGLTAGVIVAAGLLVGAVLAWLAGDRDREAPM